MNNIFTVTTQFTLSMFRAQGLQDEPESKGIIYNFGYNTTFFSLFFPLTIIEWNNLDPHLRKSENFLVFKKQYS